MQKVTGFIQKSLLGAVVAVLVCFGNAYAATCTTVTSTATSNWITVLQTTSNTGVNTTNTCASSSYKYYRCGTAYYKVQDCTKCTSGTLTATTFASGYDNTYNYCKVSSVTPVLPPATLCDPDVDCGLPSASYWSTLGNGYQRITTWKCDTTTNCEWVQDGYKYRCANGYYGTANCTGSTSSTCTGCSRCEPQDGVYGTVAAGNGKAKTDCYISSSTSLTNTLGTYKFTSTCYYTN